MVVHGSPDQRPISGEPLRVKNIHRRSGRRCWTNEPSRVRAVVRSVLRFQFVQCLTLHGIHVHGGARRGSDNLSP